MNEEILKEDLSKNKKLTPELKKRIKKIWGINICIILFIVLYMYLMFLAYYKMELDTFSYDLKVLSVGFLAFAIYKFEQGYKKDNEKIFLTGIESLGLALITLFMISFISIEEFYFRNIVIGFMAFSLIYYVLKSLYLTHKIKKEHKKNISDVRDIIQ